MRHATRIDPNMLLTRQLALQPGQGIPPAPSAPSAPSITNAWLMEDGQTVWFTENSSAWLLETA